MLLTQVKWTLLADPERVKKLQAEKEREERIELAEQMEYENRLHQTPFEGLAAMLEKEGASS